ncbi:MAG: FG-GAP repeat protein, partial [Thermoplasmata archaeon]|nr:FG-GAP repeat protein [Thermoplasmata archaeon]
ENSGDKFGYSVHYAGDIDQDGAPDVIVGAPYYDDGATSDCGKIYIFKGGSSMDTTHDWNHTGEQAGEHFGWSVGHALNIDGGWNMAVLAGAPHHDNGGDTDAGETEVLMIPEYGSIVIPIIVAIMLFARKRRKRTRRK